MILYIIDKQRRGRSPNHLLYCRRRAVDSNRWRINNISGRTRDQGSVIVKLKCNLYTQVVSQTLDQRYCERWTEIVMHTHMDTQTHMHLMLFSQRAMIIWRVWYLAVELPEINKQTNRQPPWKRFPHSRHLHGYHTVLLISFPAVKQKQT